MIWAFLASIGCIILVLSIARAGKGSEALNLILAGIMISSLFQAGTSYLKLIADPNNTLPEITYWLMGSLSGITMKEVGFVCLPMLAGFAVLIFLSWKMNLLTIDDEEARTMGVNTRLIRIAVVIASTLLTATSVSVSGIIGWIGLVIPHFCRMIFGCDYRRIIPAAIIMGGAFLLVVDDIARCMATTEVPIGILTAFVGAPIFAYLLMAGGKRS
jgi:iron complex transport system permease protein